MARRIGFLALLVAAGVLLAPTPSLACPICFGAPADSVEARSLNWAVFTLLGVTGGVLSGFVGFMFHLLKRSRQALGSDAAVGAATRSIEAGGRS